MPLLMEEPGVQRGTITSSQLVAEQGFGPSFSCWGQCCPVDKRLDQHHPIVLIFETTLSGGTFWKEGNVLDSGLSSMVVISHMTV